MDAVNQVLRGRAQTPQGMERMVLVSFGLHVALALSIMLLGPAWMGERATPPDVMMISLGGPGGPETGGNTPISSRPVQRATELPEVPQPVRAPAAAVPDLTVPAPEATRPARTPVEASSPSPEPTGSRTPTTGPEERAGTAVADTGVTESQGFGLSSGGGEGTGVYLDVGNFCCPEYIRTMEQLIKRNWNYKQPVGGDVTVKFTILRNGVIAAVALERSSGQPQLDRESQRALALTRQLPPLPARFPDDQLTVHLVFRYQRS